jgi:hypothetical protein
MARKVDPALTRRAVSWVRRARSRADSTPEGLSEWENGFLDSLEERLGTFGSAFADPDKGQLSSPLSLRQGLKVRQISRKGQESRESRTDGAEGAEAGERPASVRGTGWKTPKLKRGGPLRRSKGLGGKTARRPVRDDDPTGD